MMNFLVEILKRDFEYFVYEFIEAPSLVLAALQTSNKYNDDKNVISFKVTHLPKIFSRKKTIICSRCSVSNTLSKMRTREEGFDGYRIYHYCGELMFLGRYKGDTDTEYTYGLFAILQSSIPVVVVESTKDEAMNRTGIFRGMSCEDLEYPVNLTDDVQSNDFVSMASQQDSSWCISLVQGNNPQERDLKISVDSSAFALEMNLTYG